mmetsp:Transcript_34370/g.34950  ORF Transcript_34370/g.34950 Transcript_34370/m.34950 type:complete len:94 (+) Transcript_34370:115-396(+)
MGRKGGGGMRIKQMGPTKEQRAMMKEMQAAQNGEMKNPMDEFMIPPDQMINLPPTPDRNYKMFWPMRKFYLFCLMLYLCHLSWYTYMFSLFRG